jgi:hypothetical protein
MMIKTAALLIVLSGLAVAGLRDRDGRVAAGDLAARMFGYVVRVELTVERRTPPDSRIPFGEWGEGSGILPGRCILVADSVTPVVVWR